MKRRVALPFLTLSEPAVGAEPWQVSLDDGDWSEAVDYIPNWDPSSVLRFRRTVTLFPERVSQDLGIPQSEISLLVAARVGTGQGRLPRMLVARVCKELRGEDWSCDFEVAVAGRQLSALINLRMDIALHAPVEGAPVLSPSRPGDRLWRDDMRLRLEGEEPRFPLETFDPTYQFGGTVQAASPWFLHWSPRDWNRDFHGAVRLYLNETHKEFLERVEAQDGPTLQLLVADVIGQICERFVLDSDAAEMMNGAEPGSVGAQAAAWLRKAWPGRDVSFVKAVLENRPGSFRSTILALARLEELS